MADSLTTTRDLSEEREADAWLTCVRRHLRVLTLRKRQHFDRRVSIGDLLTERSDNAAAYGFGEGTTMYDNVLVLGEVHVGRHTWIGPGCILDGSGAAFGSATTAPYRQESRSIHIIR